MRAHDRLRVLLLADTHLGFDDPLRPRVARRRRGPDFFEAFERALEPALRGAVDLVVHGGDLLYRSRVPAGLVQRALEPLQRVARRGVPVFLVPGNHERGRIPFPLLARHENVHVFLEPSTLKMGRRGLTVALSGFPFQRRVDGPSFAALVERTGWHAHAAGVRLLCMHQTVEGARVGVQDFMFRRGVDVVPGQALPRGFAAVLSGHIHRAQTLVKDLAGRPLAAPVIYPGSTERTSFAEREETKGYVLLECEPGLDGGRLVHHEFVPLPTRPMAIIDIHVDRLEAERLAATLRARFAACHPHAIVRVRVRGTPMPGAESVLSAASLRALASPQRTVSFSAFPKGSGSDEVPRAAR